MTAASHPIVRRPRGPGLSLPPREHRPRWQPRPQARPQALLRNLLMGTSPATTSTSSTSTTTTTLPPRTCEAVFPNPDASSPPRLVDLAGDDPAAVAVAISERLHTCADDVVVAHPFDLYSADDHRSVSRPLLFSLALLPSVFGCGPHSRVATLGPKPDMADGRNSRFCPASRRGDHPDAQGIQRSDRVGPLT